MKKTTTFFWRNLKIIFSISLSLFCNILHSQPGSVDLTFGKPVPVLGDSTRFNDDVRAILVQPDGKAVMAGKFTQYNGSSNSYNRIIRLNPDGNIDASFSVSTGFNNSQVNTLALQSNGKILAGGSFSTYNAITCGKVARIKADGSADVPFLLNIGNGFNYDVNVLAVQPDGKIIVGGNFTMFNTTICNHIVRLDSTGLLDPTFNIGNGFNNDVNSILIQPDGKIIVGGYFNSYGSTPSLGHICRLNTDGTIDNNFYLNSGTGFNSAVTSLAMQSDGKIIAGGIFDSYNSASINKVARIDSTGILDISFSTGSVFSNQSYLVHAVLVQSNGNIVVSGGSLLVPGGIAILNSNGALSSTLSYNYGGFSGGEAYALANESNGNILCGGSFTRYNNTKRSKVAQLYADGWQNDTYTVTSGFDELSSLYKITLQPDGKILAGGYDVYNYNGTSCYRIARIISQDGAYDTSFHFTQYISHVNEIVYDTIHNKILVGGYDIGGPSIYRLNLDGTLDPLFFSGTGFNGEVESINVQPNGKIVVAGDFSSYDNTPVHGIVRLDEYGILDVTFNSNTGIGFNGFGSGDTKLLSDGKIIAVGGFTTFNGNICGHIVRINSDGTYDNTFQSGSGLNGFGAGEIAIQSDGKMLVAETQNGVNYNGNSFSNIVRIDTSGAYDNSFNASIGGITSIRTIAIQSDGKIIAGGSNLLTGQVLVRLLTDGTIDNGFIQSICPTGGINGVNTVAIQTDGKILSGGTFTQYNNLYINRIVRLGGGVTGIDEINKNDIFSVFPNPTTGKMIINLSKSFNEPFTAIITNVLGAKIKSFKIEDEKTELQLNQPAGIYFLTLQNANQRLTQKIILQ